MHEGRLKGRFLVLEGIDGAGTTTQLKRATAWLEARGERVLATAQPSEGPVGRRIREVLKGGSEDGAVPATPQEIALLFAADRLDHVRRGIEPALQRGTHVICDRYVGSSIAYQGVDLDETFVRTANQFAREPDWTIYVRVRPEIAMERIQASRADREIFERLDFQRQVAERYDRHFQGEMERGAPVTVLDGEANPDAVSEGIYQVRGELLEQEEG